MVYKALNMPGTYQPECSHHTVIPTLSTHQQSELVLLTKLVILSYNIHFYKFTTARTQTVPHWMPTSLVWGSDSKFILMITRTSTQQFIGHIPVCCQSNSSLTGFPSLWRQHILTTYSMCAQKIDNVSEMHIMHACTHEMLVCCCVNHG